MPAIMARRGTPEQPRPPHIGEWPRPGTTGHDSQPRSASIGLVRAPAFPDDQRPFDRGNFDSREIATEYLIGPVPPSRPHTSDSPRKNRGVTPKGASCTHPHVRHPHLPGAPESLVQGQPQDNHFLTHKYVKKEIDWLTRRVEEVGKYFLALEHMLGTGSMGPFLQRSLREVERKLVDVETLQDSVELRGLIDSAVRLGLSPGKYEPFRERLEWLQQGQFREELRQKIGDKSELPNEPLELQQLIDDAVRYGLPATEIQPIRDRLRAVEQQLVNESMIKLVAAGKASEAAAAIWRNADRTTRSASDGRSIWHHAIVQDDMRLVDLAIQVDVPRELLDASGMTPLYYAAAIGNDQMVKRLLSAGAKLEGRSAAAEVVAECQNREERAQLELKLDGSRRLRAAHTVGGERLDIGDWLVAGEDLHLPTFLRCGGRTALHVACLRGHESTVQLLLEANAEIDVVDDLGRSPLWYAAASGSANIATKLLKAGARADLSDFKDTAKNDDDPASPRLRNSRNITTGESPALAAARGRAVATAVEPNRCPDFEAVLRALLVHGAHRDSVGLQQAARAFGAGWEVAVAPPDSLESVADTTVLKEIMAQHKEQFAELCNRYSDRISFQRYHGSLDVMLGEAQAALPSFETLVQTLASHTGGRAVVEPIKHIGQAASQGQEGEWYRTTDFVRGSIIYSDPALVPEALYAIEKQCARQIRLIEDRLCSDPGPSKYLGIILAVEVDGLVCELRLTFARMAEAEVMFTYRSDFQQGARASLSAKPCDIVGLGRMLLWAQTVFAPKDFRTILDDSVSEGPLIVVAAKAGNVEALELLLDAGADSTGIFGESDAAAICADSLNFAGLWLLLDRGATISAALKKVVQVQEKEGKDTRCSALVKTVNAQREYDTLELQRRVVVFNGSSGALSAIKRLLSSKADVHAAAEGDLPLLTHAVKMQSSPLAVALLEKGATIQGTLRRADDGTCTSALIVAKGTSMAAIVTQYAEAELLSAVSLRDLSAVHALLDAEANPDILVERKKMLDEGMMLLVYAVMLPETDALPLVKLLLKRGANLEHPDKQRRTALLFAAQQTSVAVVEELVAAGANVQAADWRGYTAAMHAAAAGRHQVLGHLIAKGANMSVTNQDGLEACTLALVAGHGDASQLLLDHGCIPDASVLSKELFVAVHKGDVDRVNFILGKTAKAVPQLSSAATDDGTTLLMAAVQKADVPLVEALVARGVRLYPKSAALGDKTAWMLACESGNKAIQKVLKAGLPRELLLMAKNSERNAMANLQEDYAAGLQLSSGSQTVIEEGYSALDHAFINECEEMEIWLCDLGIKFHGTCSWVKNLIEPVKCMDAATINRRLAAGADACAKDSKGHTPLDWAIMTQDYFEILMWGCVDEAVLQAEQRALQEAEQPATPGSNNGPLSPLPAGGQQRRSIQSGSQVSDSSRTQLSGGGGGAARGGARRSQAQGRRKSAADRPRDPTGVFASIEDSLVGAGGLLGENIRSETYVMLEPLRRGEVPACKRRIIAKADLSVIDDRGTGLVHLALEGHFGELAELLVRGGASPDHVDGQGRTVFKRALELKQQNVAAACLDMGANLTVNGEFETNLLFIALESGLAEIVLKLLQQGGSPNSRDAHGRTVMRRALELKCEVVFLECLKYKDIDVGEQDKFGTTLAHVALETGQMSIAERIIRNGGIEMDALDRSKRTALRRAVELKSEAVALACLDAGATAKAADPPGQLSVAHIALQNSSPALAERLIKKGSLVSAVDSKGFTVLARVADQQIDRCINAGLKQLLEPLGSYKVLCKKAATWILNGPENADVRNRADRLCELPEKVKALDASLEGSEAQTAITELLAGSDCFTVLGLSAKDIIKGFHNPVDAEESEEEQPKPTASPPAPAAPGPAASTSKASPEKPAAPESAPAASASGAASESAQPQKEKEPSPKGAKTEQPAIEAEKTEEFDEEDFEEDDFEAEDEE